MYEEKVVGGKYFTLKRTDKESIINKNGSDMLIISIADIKELIKEIGDLSDPKTESIKDWFLESNWNNAIIDVSKYLVDTIINLNMIIKIKIEVDSDLVNWNKDFDYENTIKINNDITILNFSVKNHSLNKEFVKAFIRYYNKKVDEE